jgi:WD repeat-containing protein 61
MAWAGADQTLSVSADGGLSIFSSPTGDIMQALPAHPVGITAVSTSANGTSALFNSLDGRTSLLDLESRTIVAAAEGGYSAQREPAWTTTLAPDGQTYASTGKSGSATIHSAAPGPSFGEAVARLVSGASPKFGVCCAYVSPYSRCQLM